MNLAAVYPIIFGILFHRFLLNLFIPAIKCNVERLFNFRRGHRDIASRRAQPSQRCRVATELPCVNQVLESSRGEQSSRGTSGEPWRLLRLHLRCNVDSKLTRKLSPPFLLSFLRSFHAAALTRYQDARLNTLSCIIL